jgi:hypothetical protein
MNNPNLSPDSKIKVVNYLKITDGCELTMLTAANNLANTAEHKREKS